MNNAPLAILDPQDPCSPLAVGPAQTALLLLDFHVFIAKSQPEDRGPAVIAAAAALRTWAKARGILVAHCLIDLRATTPADRKMAARANAVRDKMQHEAPAAKGEVPDVAAEAGEYMFYRPPSHVSALGSYGLQTWLEQHGVRSLVLAGFSTSGCVINTAKGAADAGYVVTLVDDACGDKDSAVHEMITGKLLRGQAHVVQSAEFVEAWTRNDGDITAIEEQTGKLAV
ncbi:hypothetical protein SEUCBS139899_005850 [Sporothrix eucalyptigena]|uniref:Isochorismatase-like domain-containing protein n=1 Tax=Sporothrix eucalyptigena TaxID=1812306 RepID=A0ABP0C9U8_9PEZI